MAGKRVDITAAEGVFTGNISALAGEFDGGIGTDGNIRVGSAGSSKFSVLGANGQVNMDGDLIIDPGITPGTPKGINAVGVPILRSVSFGHADFTVAASAQFLALLTPDTGRDVLVNAVWLELTGEFSGGSISAATMTLLVPGTNLTVAMDVFTGASLGYRGVLDAERSAEAKDGITILPAAATFSVDFATTGDNVDAANAGAAKAYILYTPLA